MSELANNPTPVPEGPPGIRARLQQGVQDWRQLSQGNKSVLLIALLAASVAASIVLLLWSTSENYVPLYGKQELYDSANVLALLEKEQLPFQLEQSSGQILVPDDRLAEIRIAMAARGVRAALPSGLEALEGATGFGTSEFMESVRYRHALEGELARTIMALDVVRSARVHLAVPKRTLFVGREETLPSASVMLDLAPGQSLAREQVEAIVNLIAGSVSGMKPGAVTVVDQAGHLLTVDLAGRADLGQLSGQQMGYRQQLEERIRQRVDDMLLPLLGAENFRVQVAADLDFSQVEETRETLDPKAVLRSETGKRDSSSDSQALGIPGALSNQPPMPTPDKQGSKADNDSRTEREEFNRQFESGRAITHTQYQPGRIRQLSVAVLVNNAAAPNEAKRWSQAELAQMQAMVQKTIGFDVARGDQFNLTAFTFKAARPESAAPDAVAAWWLEPRLQNLLRYGIGGLLGLVLILFGIRPLVKHLIRPQGAQPLESPDTEPVILSPLPGGQRRHDAPDEDGSTDGHPDVSSLQAAQAVHLRASTRLRVEALPEPGTEFDLQLQHLQLLADKDTVRVAEVIKLWISGHERD